MSANIVRATDPQHRGTNPQATAPQHRGPSPQPTDPKHIPDDICRQNPANSVTESLNSCTDTIFNTW